MLYGKRSSNLLYSGLIYLCVKWIQTACYMDFCFVVKSYWNELDAMCGSTRE